MTIPHLTAEAELATAIQEIIKQKLTHVMDITISIDDLDIERAYHEMGFEGRPYEVTFWVEIFCDPADPSVGYDGELSVQSVERNGKKVMTNKIPQVMEERLEQEVIKQLEEKRRDFILDQAGY
jgi:hypothetical protein